MSTLIANRGVQYGLWAEFRFSFADAMIDVNGNLVGFKNAAGVFEPIKLPANAVVVGGDLTVETASNESGAAATIAVGDKNLATRYLAATSVKAAGRTVLGLTGYRGVGEDIRITVANTNGDATAGVYSLRVHYTISGRTQEVQAT